MNLAGVVARLLNLGALERDGWVGGGIEEVW